MFPGQRDRDVTRPRAQRWSANGVPPDPGRQVAGAPEAVAAPATATPAQAGTIIFEKRDILMDIFSNRWYKYPVARRLC